MSGKTDRILGYLPLLFKASSRGSALRALVGAFGDELSRAENGLAATMAAAWVDHADRGAEQIDDLARIGSLFGLAPRDDESVEEFRAHLKRYVGIFLDGTVTVDGVLKLAAENLMAQVADDPSTYDHWWSRTQDTWTSQTIHGADMSALLLGSGPASATGLAASSAQLRGWVDLSGGLNLTQSNMLYLALDGAEPIEIDLTASAAKPHAVSAQEILQTLQAELPTASVTLENGFLVLQSNSSGVSAKLEVLDGKLDAAQWVFGLPPRLKTGAAEHTASITGVVDLSAGADLSDYYFLRLAVDGTTRELDLTSGNPGHRSLDQIVAAINQGGEQIASKNGPYLQLMSTTTGQGGVVSLQGATTRDARHLIMGSTPSFNNGRGPTAATLTGTPNLRQGLHLPPAAGLKLVFDDGPVLNIPLTQGGSLHKSLDDLAAAINSVAGQDLATHNGIFLKLTSPTTGPNSSIRLLHHPHDAAEMIFGIPRRKYFGQPATAAQLFVEPTLNEQGTLNVWARHLLRLGVDGHAPITIDLRAEADNPTALSLDLLANLLQQKVPGLQAVSDGQRLTLASQYIGSGSALKVEPVRTVRRTRFTTSAPLVNEATTSILGFITARATGSDALPARIVGRRDFSRGLDLSSARYLRLTVDGKPPLDINCSGTRLKHTTPDEVVEAINGAMGSQIAFTNGKTLTLVSPGSGESSRLQLSPPRFSDALPLVLGLEPGTFRGQAASSVVFVAIKSFKKVDLPEGAAIKLAIDQVPATEVEFPKGRYTPLQIRIRINQALGDSFVAITNQGRLRITSRLSGTAATLSFLTPAGVDVTQMIFGITSERTYTGLPGSPATARGVSNLEPTVNLSLKSFIRLRLDGGAPIDVNCGAKSANPSAATPGEIADSINLGAGSNIAQIEAGHLVLRSAKPRSSGLLELLPFPSDDAAPLLFGDAPLEAIGTSPQAAMITGKLPLTVALDLSNRALFRLSVNGEEPVDLNVAGNNIKTTFPDEVVAAINARFPAMAQLVDDGYLQLTSPSQGTASSLEILPRRCLLLEEYPPQIREESFPSAHGMKHKVHNSGVTASTTVLDLTSANGAVGPGFFNESANLSFRFLGVLDPKTTLRLQVSSGHLSAQLYQADGSVEKVEQSQIALAPPGAVAQLPFSGKRYLVNCNKPTLCLDDPYSQHLVCIEAITELKAQERLGLTIEKAIPPEDSAPPAEQDGSMVRLTGRLRLSPGQPRLLTKRGTLIAYVNAGLGIDLSAHAGQVVAVMGEIFQGSPPLLHCRGLKRLFNVTLVLENGDSKVEEQWEGVSVSGDFSDPFDLAFQLSDHSLWLRAQAVNKVGILQLPRGISTWQTSVAQSVRFNQAHFNQAYFPGKTFHEDGLFNISTFVEQPPALVSACFATGSETQINLRFQTRNHTPGSFRLHLPKDLPARFGGRFNQARFGLASEQGELYSNAVFEPLMDPRHLISLIKGAGNSSLVEAKQVPVLPAGFRAELAPFRKVRTFKGGTQASPARLYLAEDDVPGFIELRAKKPGAWGNDITLSARAVGGARFDVAIRFQGARFENAVAVVLGDPLPLQAPTLSQPARIGVLRAKAAGVAVSVNREGFTDPEISRPVHSQQSFTTFQEDHP